MNLDSKNLPAITIGIFTLAIVGWLAYGSEGILKTLGAKDTRLLKPDDPKIVAIGQAVYLANCASCHGKGLEGQPDWQTPKPDGRRPAPPHDVSGHTWHHASALLFDMTKYGIAEAAGLENYDTDMPAYQDVLTDEEIIAVLSFIKSTWPEEIRQKHDQLDQAAARRN
ncbi:MAG: cytochrome c [Roseibium sp.]